VVLAAAAAGGSGNGAKPSGAGAGAGGHVEMRALAMAAEAAEAVDAEPAVAADAPPHAAVQLDAVLRTIKLLERREADLRDEMKDVLGLMASAAQALVGAAAPAVLPLHLQRLERCVAAAGRGRLRAPRARAASDGARRASGKQA
jgi:hypothetical protein